MDDIFVSGLMDDDDYESILRSSSESSDNDDLETVIEIMETLHQHRKRITTRNYCEEVVPSYTEKQFISHFRIRPSLMIELAAKFSESDIYKKLTLLANSRASITPEKHILTFLWFAGHHTSSFRDIANRFDLSLSSLHDIITRVTNFLSSLASEVIKFPTPLQKQRTMTFYKEKKGFPNIIGLIGGTHIKINKPSSAATDYFNRKAYHSIILQGVCDENLKFIDAFIGYPGSVHDASVFYNSTLWTRLEELCNGCYLLGDGAYPLLVHLLTPYWDNGHLTAAQNNFNAKLGSCRESIEHALGALKQRFCQLYHLKLRDHERLCSFIRACCVLHNLADKDDLVVFEGEDHPEDVQPDSIDYHKPHSLGNDLRDEICEQLFLCQNKGQTNTIQ